MKPVIQEVLLSILQYYKGFFEILIRNRQDTSLLWRRLLKLYLIINVKLILLPCRFIDNTVKKTILTPVLRKYVRIHCGHRRSNESAVVQKRSGRRAMALPSR